MSKLGFSQLGLNNPNYYVYNGSKDTLYLTKIDFRTKGFLPKNSSNIFDTIQIDGIGSKEIIFERIYSGDYRNIMQAHQEEEFAKIHKYEIWNLDTKTLLFEAICFYEYRYENWSLVSNHTSTDDGWTRGVCSYSYNFSIDSIGRITISEVKTISSSGECTPDKKEGFYIFKNGQYVKE